MLIRVSPPILSFDLHLSILRRPTQHPSGTETGLFCALRMTQNEMTPATPPCLPKAIGLPA